MHGKRENCWLDNCFITRVKYRRRTHQKATHTDWSENSFETLPPLHCNSSTYKELSWYLLCQLVSFSGDGELNSYDLLSETSITGD
jgi:hypothetical protein